MHAIYTKNAYKKGEYNSLFADIFHFHYISYQLLDKLSTENVNVVKHGQYSQFQGENLNFAYNAFRFKFRFKL